MAPPEWRYIYTKKTWNQALSYYYFLFRSIIFPVSPYQYFRVAVSMHLEHRGGYEEELEKGRLTAE
jgi:hypothetical protein